MKKLITFAVVILAIFGGLAYLTTSKTKQGAEGNPYNKEELHPETVKQLDDSLYQNQILPDELDKIIKEHKDATVYFYSPICPHCRAASPVIVPMADGMDIDLKKFNLLEFEDGWTTYEIDSTPTIVHYEDGREVSRIIGAQDEEAFKSWFEQVKQ